MVESASPMHAGRLIPLNKITALSMDGRNDDLLTISIQLITEHFEHLYRASMKEDAELLLTQFRKLKEAQ